MRHIISLPGLAEANRKLDLLLAAGGVVVPPVDPDPDPDPDPVVTLQPLIGSGVLRAGSPSSGTITGKTAGSTLTTTVPGLTITGTSYTFDGSGAAGTYAITETLAGATNSPLSSQVVVQAAGSTGGVSWTGVTWTGVNWGGGGTTPASVAVSGPATIVEGTGGATPATVAVTGPATIAEGTGTTISAAVTGPATIAEGN